MNPAGLNVQGVPMLTRWLFVTMLIPIFLIAFSGVGVAQQENSGPSSVSAFSGFTLFNSYCATCHGTGGKGDGQIAAALHPPPADLTAIAKNNGGTFSREDVARIIDGRNPIKGHGGKDMPAWGEALGRTADGPSVVAQKIQSLVLYVESLQQKP
jgi:mono/diheme cytochrome c family protein